MQIQGHKKCYARSQFFELFLVIQDIFDFCERRDEIWLGRSNVP
jgi:hypothetical protein